MHNNAFNTVCVYIRTLYALQFEVYITAFNM